MFDAYGNFTGELPAECIRDCSESGAVDDAVTDWRKSLEFTVPRMQAIRYLRAFGAWPVETDEYDTGLVDMTDDALADKVLWIACCEIRETGEWFGLVH